MRRPRKGAINPRDGASWHLLVARRGDGTVDTLCSETGKTEYPISARTAMCGHCSNVLADMNADAGLVVTPR